MTRTTLSRRLTCHLTSGAIKEHYKGRHHNKLTRKDLDENTTILDKERDPRLLLYLEAIYIRAKQPSINIQTENIQNPPYSGNDEEESSALTHRAAEHTAQSPCCITANHLILSHLSSI
ncbi:hypothetical protein E2C01_076216 [Portunus trituberculatus]|uniref:Uncharacterized protein n=1 Tax=Portunus trituberculatus TaxID=210409 RepID=A0A5B7I846_PORTR|nr:hypothetical protein [Portunus trituberculatus]